MINRFPKMCILWYVIGKEKLGMSEDLAKAYGVWKATLYAAAKYGRFAVGRTKADQTQKGKGGGGKRRFEILRTPVGDAIECGGGREIVLYFGKSKKQKITPQDFDRKVIAKFPNRRFFEEYVLFAKELIKDKGVHYFKSRWYKDLWCRVRDKDWAEQLHIPAAV